MVYSDAVGGQGIVQHIDFLAGTDSTSFPIADKTRLINRYYYRVLTAIERAAGRAQPGDSNLAALPKQDLTMSNGVNNVLLPDTNRKIKAIEIKDIAGNWTRLQEIDFADKTTSISSLNTTSGFPRFYDLIGSYIYLDPAPSSALITLASGLRVWASQEPDVFTTADTTQEPGFVDDFHELLAIGPAWDYVLVNGTEEKADRLKQKYLEIMKDLSIFYADRNQDSPNRFRPLHRTADYQ